MSTKTAKACLYPVISAVALLVVCPVAQAQPDRQCYQMVAGRKFCIDLSNSGSTQRDCYLVPMGPRCFISTALPERDGRIQLPNGQWALPLPQEQWPPPGQEIQWPYKLEDEQPAQAPEQPQPRGTRHFPDWDFLPGR